MFVVKKYYVNMIYRLSTLNESLLHCFFHWSKLTLQLLQKVMKDMKFARQGFLLISRNHILELYQMV